ncbi:hypothetical protein [Flavobacterium covae]|uniref:hypothetical protein n=1 Tax=Flavobacterium covae TaxID=2906076 RepID=UPI000F505A40|nr:hypothetical protein [Flavobacterium covae]
MVTYYSIILENNLLIDEFKSILSDLFKISLEKIGHLYEGGENYIYYENFERNKKKISFYNLFDIYIHKNIEIQVGLTNNLLFALELSRLINQEVLISSESRDLEEWILIEPSNKIYLVYDNESSDINNLIINKEQKKELSLAKTKKIFEKISILKTSDSQELNISLLINDALLPDRSDMR